MYQVIQRIPLPFNSEYFPDGIPIYGFGMMLFLAFLLCTWLAGRRAEREGISRETVQDLAIWVFAGGLLGARICFLLNEKPIPGFVEFFTKLPRIWDGGIILYGAVIGGLVSYFLAYWLIYRKKGLQTRRLADAVAPSIALGLMLGRFGCFLNGCCFGGVACAACVVPTGAMGFPLSAPPREVLVQQGIQTAAGFTLRTIDLGHDRRLSTEVEQVDPNSAAYVAGLRPGATIVAVNGKPVQSGETIGGVLALGTWPRGQWSLTLEYRPAEETETETITFQPTTLPLYPTQLYEVISMGLLMLVLLAYEGFRRNPGQVAAILMIGYGIHRFLNEILVAAGVAMWVWLQKFKKIDPPVEPVGRAAQTPSEKPTVKEPVAATPGP